MPVYGSAINVRRNSWEGPLMMFPVTHYFQVLLLQVRYVAGPGEPSASPTALTISDLSPLPG